MRTKALCAILLLLSVCLLLSACGQKELDPADYGLPADVRVVEGVDGRPWIVKQPVEKTLPITLPETEDFALRSHANGSFFGLKKHQHDYGSIVHARFDTNKYYIRFYDEEWLYAPDGDGTYWLYEPYGDTFRKQKTSKTEEEVKTWFFTDLSEGSMSIAMICGVWGEPTGKQKTMNVYNDNRGNGDDVLCNEYNFHGILQYANPETGLAVGTVACCDWYDEDALRDHYLDVTTHAVYYFVPEFEGQNVWQNVSVNHQKPVLEG